MYSKPEQSSNTNKKDFRLFILDQPWTPFNEEQMKLESFLNKLTTGKKPFMISHTQNKDNPRIPAGYTYLGQFIIHDLSFQIETFTDRNRTNSERKNFRSPSLDLDSLYHQNPIISSIYYDHSSEKYNGRTHFLNDIIIPKKELKCIYDLGRKFNNPGLLVPIIPDMRNDENIVISQLHVAFQRFHNRSIDCFMPIYAKHFLQEKSKGSVKEDVDINEVLNRVKKSKSYRQHGGPALSKSNNESELMECKNQVNEDVTRIQSNIRTISDKAFERARKELKRYYHWIIIHDYLPKVLGVEIVQRFLQKYTECSIPPLSKYNKECNISRSATFIPIEFSVAAFRFGHSMVKTTYNFNSILSSVDIFSPKGINKRPTSSIDWSLFFFEEKRKSENFSRKILPSISKIMTGIPDEQAAIRNVVYRNLWRSYNAQIDEGQSIAYKLKDLGEINDNYEVLNYMLLKKKAKSLLKTLENQFESGLRSEDLNDYKLEYTFKDFCNHSPLWFYILMEAWVYGKEKEEDPEEKGGLHLGPVGGYIVAWVFFSILSKDDDFFLKDPNWKPNFFIEEAKGKRSELFNRKNTDIIKGGDNSMIEFLKFAGVYEGAYAEDYEVVIDPSTNARKCQKKKPPTTDTAPSV